MRVSAIVLGAALLAFNGIQINAKSSAEVSQKGENSDWLRFVIGDSPEGLLSLMLSKFEMKVSICEPSGKFCSEIPLSQRELPANQYFENCSNCSGKLRSRFTSITELQKIVVAHSMLYLNERLQLRWQLQAAQKEDDPVAVAFVEISKEELMGASRLKLYFEAGLFIEDLACYREAYVKVQNRQLPLLSLKGYIQRFRCSGNNESQ